MTSDGTIQRGNRRAKGVRTRGSNGPGRAKAGLRVRVSVRPTVLPASRRVREVCRQFGMAPQSDPMLLVDNVVVPLQPGQILLVTGPSGTGKSHALRCLAGQLGRRAVWVSRQVPDNRSAIVDQVAPDLPLSQAVSILTACGLGEPRLWLRRYADLSDGEQFRVRLAMGIGAGRARGGALIADEFCAVLHRRLACAMAFNLRKMISASGLCLIAATTHEDLQADLQPDWVLKMPFPAPLDSRPQVLTEQPISFFRRLWIGAGRLSDYKLFEAMHYRKREGLGPLDKIFVLRDGVGGEALGVAVYAYAPLSLRLRNAVTGGVYHRAGKAINRDFRILRRLVVHPDIRGCGLAHWLVAQTLPQVGRRYVECLAAMGAVNPVFERAGMVRLGLAGVPARQQRACEALQQLRVDPLAKDFEEVVTARSEVRAVVARSVHTWLRATTGRTIEQMQRMTSRQLAAGYLQLMATEPVYYLWSGDSQEMVRLRSEAERLRVEDRGSRTE